MANWDTAFGSTLLAESSCSGIYRLWWHTRRETPFPLQGGYRVGRYRVSRSGVGRSRVGPPIVLHHTFPAREKNSGGDFPGATQSQAAEREYGARQAAGSPSRISPQPAGLRASTVVLSSPRFAGAKVKLFRLPAARPVEGKIKSELESWYRVGRYRVSWPELKLPALVAARRRRPRGLL